MADAQVLVQIAPMSFFCASGLNFARHCRAIEVDPRLPEIKKKVEEFASSFPMPGFAVGQTDAQVHLAPAVGAKAPYANGNAVSA